MGIGCHRAILAARSQVFKQANDQILEVHMPDIDAETMISILQYCYTNSISVDQIATPQLVEKLLLAAKQFDLDPLYKLCKHVLATVEKQNLPTSLKQTNLIVPNSFINLTPLFDDETTSDVVVKTESSKIIHCHQCILLSQVPSLATKLKENVIDISKSRHESAKRVLSYLYTGKVVAETQEDLSEDIVTAKLLLVDELVSKLERNIHINDTNAMKILKFAVQHDLTKLKENALDNLANNDYDNIFQSIKCLETSCATIVSELEAVVKSADHVRRNGQSIQGQGISLRASLGLVVAATASLVLLRLQIENEYFVTVTNICFCCVVVAFFL